MLSTVLYYELGLAMKVPIPVGITVYLLTWGLGHLRCLVSCKLYVRMLKINHFRWEFNVDHRITRRLVPVIVWE